VRDHDGDVTLKGAFGAQEVPIVPAHDWKSVPLGRASISESGDDVLALLKFNLDVPAAADWFKALKFDHATGTPMQEYSYGYEILSAEKGEKDGKPVQFLKSLKAIEVSPVLLGAGIGTRTLDVKDRAKAYAEVGGSWEAIQRAIRAAARAELNDEYCYIEATLDATVLVVSYRDWMAGKWEETYFEFDWTLAEDGTVTLSNRREVSLDLVVTAKAATFTGQFESAVAELQHFHGRSKALAALRAKENRSLSQASRDRLKHFHGLLVSMASEVDALTVDPETSVNENHLFAAYLETQAKAALVRR